MVALLFRERMKIAIVFILPVFAAVGLYMTAPRTYEAEAKLLIRIGRETETSSQVGQQPTSAPQTTQEVLNSEMAILSSRDIAIAALKEFGARTLFPRLDVGTDPDLPPSDTALRAFEKALHVAAITNSSVFTVSYEAPNPTLATKVLAHVLQLYQKQHIEAYARPISGFLDAQLADLEQTIEGLEAQAAKFKVASKIYDPAEERHQLLDRRNSLSTAIAQSRSDTARLTTRVTELRELRARTPEEIKMFAESGPSDAIERARSELLALRVQEEQLGSAYTYSSETMLHLRKQIDAVTKFLAAEGTKFSGLVRTGRNPLYDELTAEMVRAEAQIAPEQVRIAALQQEIDRVDEQLNAVEEAARTLDALQRKRDNLQTALSAFRQQQAQASMLEEMDKRRFVNIQIIEDPAPVTFDKPAHPTPLIYGVAGLAGGILLAAFVVVLIFMSHNTYLTPEAVEASVDIPVLASLLVHRASARS
jgi:uncharacterized protein involved in exopolysaccharide biosynthesis